jgi:hypothetical protein
VHFTNRKNAPLLFFHMTGDATPCDAHGHFVVAPRQEEVAHEATEQITPRVVLLRENPNRNCEWHGANYPLSQSPEPMGFTCAGQRRGRHPGTARTNPRKFMSRYKRSNDIHSPRVGRVASHTPHHAEACATSAHCHEHGATPAASRTYSGALQVVVQCWSAVCRH